MSERDTTHRWDVIIIGARIAGATRGARLGRAGLRVLLLERAREPGDYPRQASWNEATEDHWATAGLLPAIDALHPSRRHTLRRVVGDAVIAYAMPPRERGFSQSARRVALDPALAAHVAALPTVAFRPGSTAQGVLRDAAGRVVGVRGQAGGRAFEERARFVVGADGRHSWLARQVGACPDEERPSGHAFYFTHYADSALDADVLTLVREPGASGAAAPVDGGLVAVMLVVPEAELAAFRAGLPGTYDARVRASPYLGPRTASGRREERIAGATGLALFKRPAGGPGWALVGDAGYHLHPVTALGTNTAVAGAALLAEALGAILRDGVAEDVALADYQRRRDTAFQPHWDATVETLLASGPPTPGDVRRARALAADPELCRMELGVRAGRVPRAHFEAPLRRVLDGAPPDG